MDGERTRHADAFGHRGVDQRVEGVVTQQLEHRLRVRRVWPDVPRDKAVNARERAGGSGLGHGMKVMLPSMRWLFFTTPPSDGASNMALDEALMLYAARNGDAVFRVYGFS